MAEGRMLKRRITLSKKMSQLKSDKARLLWFYMLPFTDIAGRIEADPEDIRDEILRKQRNGYSLVRIQSCLEDLSRVGLIVLFHANGRQYLEFTRFADEQSLNPKKEAKTKIPGPLQEHSGNTPSISKVKLSKDNNPPTPLKGGAPPQKQKFLDFVLLTEDEHKKLIERLGDKDTHAYIERLNNYIGSKGKRYKSHYHTILNWSSNDANDPSHTRTSQPQSAAPRRDFDAQQSAIGETINVDQ